MIRLRAVEVHAPAAPERPRILGPIDLELAESRIALIGMNGSGKSTLARLLNGLVLPSAGTVAVRSPDGAWLDTARDGARVRRSVGFVFTHPAAQLVMPTALEDVALSLRRRHRDRAERDRLARAALDGAGLAALADRSVHTLSGGQQQLLALTSVLAMEPTILVADEPTTLLDLRNARRVGDLLLGLPQQLVIATHDLELAERCERALLVDDGRIVADGAPDDVIARYRELAR